MDREHLDLSISSIEMIHSIINDIENGEDVRYNASIIPDLEYAVECIKDVILGKPSKSEPELIQPKEEPVKIIWADTRKSIIKDYLKHAKVTQELEDEDVKKAYKLINEFCSLESEIDRSDFIANKVTAQNSKVKKLVLKMIALGLSSRC